MASRYKLRCSVVGHEKDVRGVIPSLYPDGGFISGSRDVTTRAWMPIENTLGFTEAHVMSGHNNFVSCVCIMPPDDKYPQGLILTGSNDKTILAYTLASPSPVYKLEGHTNTVCSLAAGKFGTLISGSWDETAKVWLKQKCLMTLKGHSAAVWSVAILPEGGFMLTGSADKTIKMWKAGKCERTFIGHDDCVRSLVVISTTEFLSCGNDASVRRWLMTGECVHVYFGHTNYVYSLALMPNGADFVSVGEDRSLRVWRGGECDQVISHPTESVWCVCVLENGDIVTGASDGIIRVFSADPSRQAPPEEQKAFEETLASSSITTQVGDIPVDQLKGPEALVNPGKRDGQNLMVKDGSGIMMYQWNAGDSRWVKIGDVVGGSGGSQAKSGKQLYQGKEYDYVFDVELQEDSPPLKLPYNLSEDPWMAAHNFLANNDLSQMFLDQVAKFIQDQIKGASVGPRPEPTSSDPFTGSGRYVPGSTGASTGAGVSGSTDPFTGGGRYVPTYSEQTAGSQQFGADPLTGGGSYRPSGSSSTPAPSVNTFFPKKDFIGFDQANIPAILGKLKDFNSQADSSKQIPEDKIGAFEGLMAGRPPIEGQVQQLWDLLLWPAGVLFPVLDILRLAIRNPEICLSFCNPNEGPMFVNFLLASISQDAPTANQMLALRTMANMFRHAEGKRSLLAKRDLIISGLVQSKDVANKNIQVASSSVLLNYAIALRLDGDIEAKSHCLSAAVTLAETFSDAEAVFRLLVCVGTLISGDKQSSDLVLSLGVSQFVNRCKLITDPAKVSECASLLEKSLIS